MSEAIDIIITSRLRWDLLRQTLDGLFEHYPNHNGKIHLFEDSDFAELTEEQRDDFSNLQRDYFMRPGMIIECRMARIGHVRALDELMHRVETRYVCGLEDDFLPIAPGFLEKAVEIMDNNPKCVCVSGRGTGRKDLNMHPLELVDGINRFTTKWHFKGFQYAPALHRMSDYREHGWYTKLTKFNPSQPWESEREIGNYYFKKGMWACTTDEKFFHHAGENRSTIHMR